MSSGAPEFLSLQALAVRIPDGARIALPADYSGCAMAAVRLLMRRPVRDLHIVSVPQGGFQVDMLVGAGCVARIEAAAVTLGEHGLAPRFTAAIKAGEIEMWDATCPAIHAGLQAAEKGVPFMPLRGIVGSDLLRVRPIGRWSTTRSPRVERAIRSSSCRRSAPI
jgi:glutaconate CoA-transferase subunit A